jgi:hypothetical protein
LPAPPPPPPQSYWIGYRAKRLPADPNSYAPLDATLGMNATSKYTNWGITVDGLKPQPAYNPSAIPPPLCLLSNYSEAQAGAGGFGNWPCSFKFVYMCRMMGGWHQNTRLLAYHAC